eukprot:752595-Hanusia_phi.AAC.2
MMTGDSWGSAVTRTLFDEVGPDNKERGNLNRRVALFSISYIMITTIVLVNIVVAVLLDEFTASVTREKEEQEMQLKEQRELEAKASRISGVLDPLLRNISSFNDSLDLSRRISHLFDKFDNDKYGGGRGRRGEGEGRGRGNREKRGERGRRRRREERSGRGWESEGGESGWLED